MFSTIAWIPVHPLVRSRHSNDGELAFQVASSYSHTELLEFLERLVDVLIGLDLRFNLESCPPQDIYYPEGRQT